jgi:glucose-6-phosphate 1-epimerase
MLARMDLPHGVITDTHPSGLARVRVERDACTAELFLHGATLTAWAPRGHDAVLYTSPSSVYRADKAIRGGVPICFPWFGPREGAAQHGFARTAPWRLEAAEVEASGDTVTLTLALDGDGAPSWPHRFAARYRVSLGPKLECALAVTNCGGAPFAYEDALHTYFAVRDARQLRVRGLEGLPYLDRSAGGEVARRSEEAPFALTAETDRLYLGTAAPIEIDDGARRITIAKDGSRTTVVWNPWAEKSAALADLGAGAWTSMLCVEPANARLDAIALAPGATHTTRMRVAVNAS